MSKKIIAVDIDDVLSAHAQAFVDYSNNKYGTNLEVSDYIEHWGDMWNVDHDETERRANDYHESGIIGTYQSDLQAKSVLVKLSKNYKLVVITSRRRQLTQVTEEWLKKYYANVFEAVYYAGIWDQITDHSNHMTKAGVCLEIGANYLVDDQLKHCIAAAEAGLTCLLFGEYSWNKRDNLPVGVTRVKDWLAVGQFFDEQS